MQISKMNWCHKFPARLLSLTFSHSCKFCFYRGKCQLYFIVINSLRFMAPIAVYSPDVRKWGGVNRSERRGARS